MPEKTASPLLDGEAPAGWDTIVRVQKMYFDPPDIDGRMPRVSKWEVIRHTRTVGAGPSARLSPLSLDVYVLVWKPLQAQATAIPNTRTPTGMPRAIARTLT